MSSITLQLNYWKTRQLYKKCAAFCLSKFFSIQLQINTYLVAALEVLRLRDYDNIILAYIIMKTKLGTDCIKKSQ